ncbi:unnamed protein product (macronuclear) [Paramecium tetraurelia]|uniref:Uncharacterized protein n=1 Tax=Paramecium tetraurelia TaxID=5888 RepID=A0CR96_PARTE|nr:uncharacterized protein GSPATT00009628001 [Paramecium tetraurelia]CAK73313.1 unnamed protein product [Paramecium tetraurelia]|eukprot:XP_001440710.1 hypothetical protein (macronuclear) [Paramecium tetraurelia strain d4-2]
MSSLIKKDQKRAPNQYLDFDQLVHKKYHYDQKKANDQSVKQEQYILDLKKAYYTQIISYDQQKLEIEPLFQKVELLQIERKQLMDEIEQYKMSQMEILKKYEFEYQEKDKLNKECAKLKSQIQAQQKMQLPKESQEKKCHELKESLFVTIKHILNDFLDNYNHIMGFKDESELSSNLLEELLQQIDDSIIMFVDNLPAESNKQLQSEELQHLKEQIEKTLQTVSNLQAENQDLSTALDIEKQHKEKIINQRNNQQQVINQLNNQIETITNEKKNLESQIQEIQMKNLEFQQDICRVNDFKEEENEKLKSEFIDSINELQKQISKLQIENSKLTSLVQNNTQQQSKDIEILNNKLRELESKLNQEEIKYEQKSREMIRIEKEMNQYKAEATKLFEENNLCQKQLEVIKEKRKQDKEVLDQQKEKFKKLKLQLQQSENESQTKIVQLEEQITQLTQQLEQDKSTQQSNQNTEVLMEKELELSKLDQLVSEQTQKINDQKQYILEMKIQINSLEQELQDLRLTNQQHQERRAVAFSEINRLEQQNSILKQVIQLSLCQRINDQDQTIKQLQSEVQELVKQPKSNSQQNHTPTHHQSYSKTLMNEATTLDSSRLSDTDSQISKTAKAASLILNGLNYFKLRPQVTNSQIEDPNRKNAEKALQKQAAELKSNLEQLYKSFLSTLLLNQVNDEKFLKFERQINECVKKTQDLNDNIEDFF